MSTRVQTSGKVIEHIRQSDQKGQRIVSLRCRKRVDLNSYIILQFDFTV